jgi:hypothetical protein
VVDSVRALITKPFDLGSFDKDIGWCGDWFTLTTEDDVHFHVLREGDENGVRRWSQRSEVTLETLDLDAGVAVLRGPTNELVFDLRAGAAVQSAFTPTGTIPLMSAPSVASLQSWLLCVVAVFRRLGLAASGVARVEPQPGGVRLFAGDEPIADARFSGEPLQELAIDGFAGKRLLLRWSSRTPRALQVAGEVLPRSAFLGLRRVTGGGLGWVARPALVRRLVQGLAADVLAAPEVVDPTTDAERGELLFAVRQRASSLARRAPELVDAMGLTAALAGLAGDQPELAARALAALDVGDQPTLRDATADVHSLLDLEADQPDSLARSVRALVRRHLPPGVPASVATDLAAPPSAEATARLRAWAC